MSLAHSAPMTLSDTSTGTPAAPNAAAMRALAGALRIGRLHREEHQLRAARAARLLARSHGNLLIEHLRLHAQPAALHRLDVLRAGDQRYVVAGAREHAAVVAAHRPCAHHRDPAEIVWRAHGFGKPMRVRDMGE